MCPCGKAGELRIHPSAVSIGLSACESCQALTGTLKLPEGLTAIGDFAFEFCKGFTGSLVLPESLTIIGQYAFEGCSGFTGPVVIPAGVNRIWQGAFANCGGITAACFEGDAPEAKKYSYDWHGFSGCAEGFTVLCLEGKAGWTTPEWNGFPCSRVDALPVAGVRLSQEKAFLTPGASMTLTASLYPAHAADTALEWTSSDETVAAVNDGVVSSVGIGTAVITVTTGEGGFSASCEITVAEAARGDMNSDGALDSNDAIYLLRNTMNGARYPIAQSGDVNGDGMTDSNDAIHLLRHTMNQTRYPLAG